MRTYSGKKKILLLILGAISKLVIVLTATYKYTHLNLLELKCLRWIEKKTFNHIQSK